LCFFIILTFFVSLAAVDLGFIIDGSANMGQANFKHALHFARDIVNAFPVSLNGVHIGLVLVSNEAKLSFRFNLYTSKSVVGAVILQTPYQGGNSATGAAISKAKTMLFDSSKREAAKVWEDTLW
jgi:hypothetical protein